MKGLIPYGEIYLCLVRGGILEIDGTEFEIELADGGYYVSAYGSSQFLAIESTCPAGPLTGGARRGTCSRLPPARIQGYILRPARILSRNRNGKTTQAMSSFHRARRQAGQECPPPRISGRDCNTPPCGNAAKTCRCAGNGHDNVPRNNSKHNRHRETEIPARPRYKDSANFPGSKGGRA
jgi:hypothetical protein